MKKIQTLSLLVIFSILFVMPLQAQSNQELETVEPPLPRTAVVTESQGTNYFIIVGIGVACIATGGAGYLFLRHKGMGDATDEGLNLNTPINIDPIDNLVNKKTARPSDIKKHKQEFF